MHRLSHVEFVVAHRHARQWAIGRSKLPPEFPPLVKVPRGCCEKIFDIFRTMCPAIALRSLEYTIKFPSVLTVVILLSLKKWAKIPLPFSAYVVLPKISRVGSRTAPPASTLPHHGFKMCFTPGYPFFHEMFVTRGNPRINKLYLSMEQYTKPPTDGRLIVVVEQQARMAH